MTTYDGNHLRRSRARARRTQAWDGVRLWLLPLLAAAAGLLLGKLLAMAGVL
jgi:hypothetical protein